MSTGRAPETLLFPTFLKNILFCEKKETHLGLEQHESNDKMFIFWVNCPFNIQIRGRGLLTPSSDSGAVTCYSQRILQIQDGGVHENVEIIPSRVQKHQHSFISPGQSRATRVIPAGSSQREPLHPHPALVFQYIQQKVVTQREDLSIRGE